MTMHSIGAASTPARASGRKRSRVTPPDADDQLEQLLFLHEVARLATTARTWDALLETVVDRTRDVMHADVSSLYLLDRDGAYLTLAATNGLDRFQIGRARVPFGEGVTGSRLARHRRAARPGRPRRAREKPAPARDPGRQGGPALPVGPRHRSAPLRGVDAERPLDLARSDRRCAHRPDRAPTGVQRLRCRPAQRRGRRACGDRRKGS